jgi:S-adenosylmethionine:tRNA ribosyltransferase-isomerase
LDLADFDYSLPKHLIAQKPLTSRRDAKLLALSEIKDTPSHFKVADLFSFFKPDDLIVLNDTRVINARLKTKKSTGGRIEILVERVLSEKVALVHMRSSRLPKIGSCITLFGNINISVKTRFEELFQVEIVSSHTFEEVLNTRGKVPLPPYIEREPNDNDASRYQTVYSRVPGAIAAPTAGLHIDQLLIDQLVASGIQISYVTLHVGSGTFRPVKSSLIKEHKMHSERVVVPAATVTAVNETREKGGRVVGVGTTVMRALETAARSSGSVEVYDGETDLFITPGFEFRVVDALMTNFHLPRSTLLMLVCAFSGFERVMNAYRIAVENNYRFFSYGDAMWLERKVLKRGRGL